MRAGLASFTLGDFVKNGYDPERMRDRRSGHHVFLVCAG